MSSKREREKGSPLDDALGTKKRKIDEPQEPSEEAPKNPRNLLKSTTLPSGKAFQQRSIQLGVYLAPIDTNEPLKGVERQLDQVLMTFVPEAQGILMGWDKPRFLATSARILDDSPFSYSYIQVDTIVWRPKRGDELEGQIKMMGPSYIGILILNTFNASIPREHIPDDWVFHEDVETEEGYWIDSDQKQLAIDQMITFSTVNVKKGKNILSVTGSLSHPAYENEPSDAHSTVANTSLANTGLVIEHKKKGDKHKKGKGQKSVKDGKSDKKQKKAVE